MAEFNHSLICSPIPLATDTGVVSTSWLLCVVLLWPASDSFKYLSPHFQFWAHNTEKWNCWAGK